MHLLGALAICVVPPAYLVSLHKVVEQGSQRSSWTSTERWLAGAQMAQLNPALFLAARRAIPPSATYAIIVGKQGDTTLAQDAAAGFSQYVLLPRRMLAEPSQAEWVLAFGTSLSAFHLPLEDVVTVAPDFSFARVSR